MANADNHVCDERLARGRGSAYFDGMAILPRPVSPRAALRDMQSFVGERRPHQWVFLALALATTFAVLLAFVGEFNAKPVWKPPEVVYVQQWQAGRTRAEIIAQQSKDLPVEKAKAVAVEARKRRAQEQFKRVAKMMGIE